MQLQNVDIGLAYLLEMETLIAKRKQRFLAKYAQYDNILCQLFSQAESV